MKIILYKVAIKFSRLNNFCFDFFSLYLIVLHNYLSFFLTNLEKSMPKVRVSSVESMSIREFGSCPRRVGMVVFQSLSAVSY